MDVPPVPPSPRTVRVRRIRGWALFVAFFGLLVFFGSQRGAPVDTGQLEFTAKTLDGAPFAGQSLAGKPVVLWFWTPWCPACAAEAPTVAKAARDHPEVTFVGVAAQDQVPAMKEFVARHDMAGLTHLADLDSSIWRRFHVTSQPAYAFLSPDGSAQILKGVSERELLTSIDLLTGP